MSDPKSLYPLLRKLVPTLIAQDILGTAPMPNNFSLMSVESGDGVYWYRIRISKLEPILWIKDQDSSLWRNEDPGWYEESQNTRKLGGIKFVLHERLYTIFLLRWS